MDRAQDSDLANSIANRKNDLRLSQIYVKSIYLVTLWIFCENDAYLKYKII